jgi:hypothetical protein
MAKQDGRVGVILSVGTINNQSKRRASEKSTIVACARRTCTAWNAAQHRGEDEVVQRALFLPLAASGFDRDEVADRKSKECIGEREPLASALAGNG